MPVHFSPSRDTNDSIRTNSSLLNYQISKTLSFRPSKARGGIYALSLLHSRFSVRRSLDYARDDKIDCKLSCSTDRNLIVEKSSRVGKRYRPGSSYLFPKENYSTACKSCSSAAASVSSAGGRGLPSLSRPWVSLKWSVSVLKGFFKKPVARQKAVP